MVNIAVMVSGGGTNLQAILDAQDAGKIPQGNIALVVASRAKVYALERARHAGVPAVVVSRAKLGAAYSRTLLEILCAYHIDLIVLAGFLTILDTAVIQAYPRRILNVHPSLIPSFCGEGFYGLKVHEAVLAYGVKVTGATVHYVNEIPDGGEIIAQKAVRVLPDDTPETLQQRVMVEAEWVLLPQAVADCCARIAQEEEKTHEMP